LKSLSLENFSKFRTLNNGIDFVGAKDYKEDENINIASKARCEIPLATIRITRGLGGTTYRHP